MGEAAEGGRGSKESGGAGAVATMGLDADGGGHGGGRGGGKWNRVREVI